MRQIIAGRDLQILSRLLCHLHPVSVALADPQQLLLAQLDRLGRSRLVVRLEFVISIGTWRQDPQLQHIRQVQACHRRVDSRRRQARRQDHVRHRGVGRRQSTRARHHSRDVSSSSAPPRPSPRHRGKSLGCLYLDGLNLGRLLSRPRTRWRHAWRGTRGKSLWPLRVRRCRCDLYGTRRQCRQRPRRLGHPAAGHAHAVLAGGGGQHRRRPCDLTASRDGAADGLAPQLAMFVVHLDRQRPCEVLRVRQVFHLAGQVHEQALALLQLDLIPVVIARAQVQPLHRRGEVLGCQGVGLYSLIVVLVDVVALAARGQDLQRELIVRLRVQTAVNLNHIRTGRGGRRQSRNHALLALARPGHHLTVGVQDRDVHLTCADIDGGLRADAQPLTAAQQHREIVVVQRTQTALHRLADRSRPRGIWRVVRLELVLDAVAGRQQLDLQLVGALDFRDVAHVDQHLLGVVHAAQIHSVQRWRSGGGSPQLFLTVAAQQREAELRGGPRSTVLLLRFG